MQTLGMLFGLCIVILGSVALIQSSGIGSGRLHLSVLVKYYTSLSNMIVVLYTLYSLLTGIHNTHPGQVAGLSVMMCIVLTFLIYHLLLSPMDRAAMRETKDRRLYFNYGNMVLHYIVPILVILRYILVESKDRIDWWDGLYWTIIPILYLAGVFLFAGISNKKGKEAFYPYPFMDVKALGVKKALWNVGVIMLIFIVFGLVVSTLIVFIV